MNSESEEKFNEHLRGLLAAELDGQLGRAERRFLVGAAGPRLKRMWWALIAMAAAAALAVAWMIWPGQPVGPTQIAHQHDTPKNQVVSANAAIASTATEPQEKVEVTQVRWYRTVDDGVVGTKDGVPVRRVRREVLDEVQTYDHASDRLTRELRPEAEQVSYVRLASF